MIFESLHESAQRGELMLVDGGMCHFHLRRDGQLTIREIISTKPGAGSLMFNRLRWTIGATSLFAKCPAALDANFWYIKRGFHVERAETTKSGRRLYHWRYRLTTLKPELRPNKIELIYCAAGNSRFQRIAIDAGMLPGAQLPNTIYYRPYFVDQNWKSPDRDKYMAQLTIHKPYMATVIDWTADVSRETVLAWMTEASQHVQVIVVIPKIGGTICQIPGRINGKPVRLGYSVPSSYGKTDVPLSEFGKRSVHLLGGNPLKQRDLANYLNVVSVDCNYHQKLALSHSQFLSLTTTKARIRHWPTLREAGLYTLRDAPYVAFEQSCKSLVKLWSDYRPDALKLPYQPEQLPLAL